MQYLGPKVDSTVIRRDSHGERKTVREKKQERDRERETLSKSCSCTCVSGLPRAPEGASRSRSIWW